jgi:hypothetical protein
MEIFYLKTTFRILDSGDSSIDCTQLSKLLPEDRDNPVSETLFLN